MKASLTIIIIEIRTGSIRKPQTVERRRFSLLAKRWKFKPFVAKIKQYYLQHIAKIGRYYKLSFLVEVIQVTHLVSTILLGSFMLADILWHLLEEKFLSFCRFEQKIPLALLKISIFR